MNAVVADVAHKKVDSKNQIWFKQVKEELHVGFTPEFLREVHQCWHVTPATKKKITEKSPLLTVETDDALFTVSSPIGGEIYAFNDKAANFPDNLTEDDVVCIIGPERKKVVKPSTVEDMPDRLAVAPAEPPPVEVVPNARNQAAQQINLNQWWADDLPPAQAPRPQPGLRFNIEAAAAAEQQRAWIREQNNRLLDQLAVERIANRPVEGPVRPNNNRNR